MEFYDTANSSLGENRYINKEHGKLQTYQKDCKCPS